MVVNWLRWRTEHVRQLALRLLAPLKLRHFFTRPYPELSKVLICVLVVAVAEGKPEPPGFATSLNDALEFGCC